MIDVTQWKWIFYNDTMLCCNEEYHVKVRIENNGRSICGKIQEIPLDLCREIAIIPNGARIIRQIISKAEDAYYKAILNDIMAELKVPIG